MFSMMMGSVRTIVLFFELAVQEERHLFSVSCLFIGRTRTTTRTLSLSGISSDFSSAIVGLCYLLRGLRGGFLTIFGFGD